MDLNLVLFLFFAACAIGSALMMVTRRNPVACAMWLIGTFFSVAAIFTLLGAFFIGVVQVLVYAGAIMVLFLFVIMLLNLGHDYRPDIRGTFWKITAAGTGLVMLALLARGVGGDFAGPMQPAGGPEALAEAARTQGTVGMIGLPLYQEYLVPLQATAMLLLVACVGAVVLAKRRI